MSQRKKATIDTAFMQQHNAVGPLDIDEVSFLMRYTANDERTDTPEQVRTTKSQPLIDNVKPQPKAFFAYLQMPPKPQSPKAAAGRLSRPRRKKIQ